MTCDSPFQLLWHYSSSDTPDESLRLCFRFRHHARLLFLMENEEALHAGDDYISAEADQEGRNDELHAVHKERACSGGEGLHIADHIQDDGGVGDSQHDEHRRIDHR